MAIIEILIQQWDNILLLLNTGALVFMAFLNGLKK